MSLRLGLNNSAPALSGLDPFAAGQQAGAGAGTEAKAAEKTVFDVKLDKFDATSKIKVIKEVRGFTELGLKEAKDLVEKAPIVVKKILSLVPASVSVNRYTSRGGRSVDDYERDIRNRSSSPTNTT